MFFLEKLSEAAPNTATSFTPKASALSNPVYNVILYGLVINFTD